MEYITTKEASAKWGISAIRITVLANEGRIPGAQRIGKNWLIPASATKPQPLKANQPRAQKETDNFSFPLYHFRPDWSDAKKDQLSKQQQDLLLAETAVLECRFSDAYPILESILPSPEDIVTEIGSLWNAGICCIALNYPEDFSKIFMRLQILLLTDFPHRDDLSIILDSLKTYIDTMDSSANSYSCNADIHSQTVPFACTQLGYSQLSRETTNTGEADTTMLEINLRLLETTSSIIAIEMMHCYLLGIYYFRANMPAIKKHAESIISLVYENKLYFPLVTYYSYFSDIFSPILTQYPEEFQNHCHKLISQYRENYSTFLSNSEEYAAMSNLTEADYKYIRSVLMGLTNSLIAEKLGVSVQTVKRRLAMIYEKLGVSTKKELIDYMHNYM